MALTTSNLDKLLYITISAVLVIIFIIFLNIFPPFNLEGSGVEHGKTIYFVDHISSTHRKVIDLFNQKYKGMIKVVPINLPFEKFSTNERKELLARYLRSGNERIDLFSVDQIWIPRFAQWALPLDRYITQSEKKNLLSYALKTGYSGDSLVAIPFYFDIAVMYARMDKLRKIDPSGYYEDKLTNSISWEELIDLHNRLGNDTTPFYTFQATDYEGLMCSYIELLSQLGGDLYKGDAVNVNTPEGVRALKMLVNLVNKYHVAPKEVLNFKETNSYQYFAKENGLLLRAWPSFQNNDNLAFSIDPTLRSNLLRVPLPHFEGKKKSAVFGGWNLMVSKYSTKVPEVMRFIHFLMTEEVQKLMYTSGGYLPVNNQVYQDSQFIRKNRDLLFYQEEFKTGIHRPSYESYTDVSNILAFYLRSAIAGERTPERALSEAQTVIETQRNSILSGRQLK